MTQRPRLREDLRLRPFGIDADARRVEHARRLNLENAGHFTCADMFSEPVWAAEQRYMPWLS